MKKKDSSKCSWEKLIFSMKLITFQCFNDPQTIQYKNLSFGMTKWSVVTRDVEAIDRFQFGGWDSY